MFPLNYSPLSGLAVEHNVPSNWALGFCLANLLSGVRDGKYHEAFERLFHGSGFFSEEGWELCRWPHRYLGAEVESAYLGQGFLAWTDPEDHGFTPHWAIYEEPEFAQLLVGCAARHRQSVVGASHFSAELAAAVEAYTKGNNCRGALGEA